MAMVFIVLLFLCGLRCGSGSYNDTIELYHYKLDIGNPNILCPPDPYRECDDGERAYLCVTYNAHPEFKEFFLENKHMKHFVETHNGIRNKIAKDYNIANMNLIYWSRELATMASMYIRFCRVEADPCHYIGEKALRVSQNYILMRGMAKPGWPGRAVRRWYVEIGTDVTSFEEFWQKRENLENQNFTNIIYPSTEFIGCAAGGRFKSVMVTCYYHPTFNEHLEAQEFQRGEPCSRCSRLRPICSSDFEGLCGVDVKMDGATAVYQSVIPIWASILLTICINLKPFDIYNQLC